MREAVMAAAAAPYAALGVAWLVFAGFALAVARMAR